MRYRTRMFGVACGVVLAACGGGGGGALGPGGGGSASFTATINGQSWAADTLGFTVTGNPGVPGSLIISGVEVVTPTNYKTLSLTVSFIGATGSYPMGINIGTTPGGTGSSVVVSGSNVTTYLTPLSGAAGTVTITSLTASRMKGTFSFTADPSPGPGASLTVTNGTFDVALPNGFTAVPPANHGSTVSANLGATAFNAATVTGIGDLGLGSFVVGGQSTVYSLTITTSMPITAPGSYTLGTEVSLSVLNFQSTDSWAALTGATGTVTVTSIGNGRVAGTFDAVLVPLGTTVGNLTVSNGSFDVLVN